MAQEAYCGNIIEALAQCRCHQERSDESPTLATSDFVRPWSRRRPMPGYLADHANIAK